MFHMKFRSHTVIYLPKTGQVVVFGLGCAGRANTQIGTCLLLPQKLPIEFHAYKPEKAVSFIT